MTVEALSYALDGPPQAPVLVMSGSLGTTRDMWLPQVEALTRPWRLLRLDHPGHGGSPVWNGSVTVEAIGQASLALLDDLGLSRVSWFGLSLGGAVGQWVAAHAPQRVERLGLCCTSARFSAPEAYRERAATVRAQGMAAVTGRVLERWFTPSFHRRHGGVVDTFRAMLESIPRDGYAACCEAVAAFDARDYLARITAPTLVIAGEEDRATPLEQAERLRDGVPGARLVVIPQAAHLAAVEQPTAVWSAVESHLRASPEGNHDV